MALIIKEDPVKCAIVCDKSWVILKGPFNNYVDKMRGGGGQKMSVFVHSQGIKTVHAGGKILSTQLLNAPKVDP